MTALLAPQSLWTLLCLLIWTYRPVVIVGLYLLCGLLAFWYLFKRTNILRDGLLYVRDERTWRKLAGRTILNPTVIIQSLAASDVGCAHPVFRAHTVYLDFNDKNFSKFCVNRQAFPGRRGLGPKKIYLNSHPCDSGLFLEFPKTTFIIHTDRSYDARFVPEGTSFRVRDYKLPWL